MGARNRNFWQEKDFITYEDLITLEARIEKAKEIAINLLLSGCNVEFVSAITGLSSEEISELPKGWQND